MVFNVVAAMVVYHLFSTFTLMPIMDSQLCEKLMSEHTKACDSVGANSTACGDVANPVYGARDKPRCAWVEASEKCDVNQAMGNVIGCEVVSVIFQLVLTLPFLIWEGYFLFVLNAYIYRYEANEGQGMMGAQQQPPGEKPVEEGMETPP